MSCMKLTSCNGTLFIHGTHILKAQYSFFHCLSNFKIPHHSQYFIMDASSLIEDLISLAEESMKKIESLLSMAEILPRSNITEFKDGTNFPYKSSTIF